MLLLGRLLLDGFGIDYVQGFLSCGSCSRGSLKIGIRGAASGAELIKRLDGRAAGFARFASRRCCVSIDVGIKPLNVCHHSIPLTVHPRKIIPFGQDRRFGSGQFEQPLP